MKITIKSKDGAARTVELAPKQQPYTIGRDPGCDVVLESPQVSAVHARLQMDARGLSVRDDGSINGVYVAGKRLGPHACPLTAGQEFTIADFTLIPRDFDAAAAPARRRPMLLLAALLALLILAGAVVLMKRRPAPSAAAPAPLLPAPAAVTGAPAPAIPAVSTQLQAQLDHAGVLISQGERALYERNDYVGAARSFNAALADNPNDLRAGNYLSLVRGRALPELLQRGEETLRAGDIAGARSALGDLEVIAPADDDVKMFRRILDGLDGFKRAKELAGRGDWDGAVKILETIIIPDDQNRVAFLNEARRQVGLRGNLREADELMQKLQYPEALAGLQRILAQADVDQRLLRETQDRSRLVEQVILVKAAAADSNRYAAAITAGGTLLAGAALGPFPAVQADLRQVFDKLRAQLLPQRAQYAARLGSAQAAMAAAGEAGRDFEAVCAGRDMLDSAVIVDFLDEKTAPSPEREQLRRKIRNYAQDAFRRGYVLKEQNMYDEALTWFGRVTSLTEPYDDLAVRAREQTAAVQKLLAARPRSAAAARSGMNTAPASDTPPAPAETQPAGK